MYDFNLISIGAGTGGCASTMRAADLGKKVALVEMRKRGTGGTCVNRGCIPTKVLVNSVSLYNEMKNASKYGIDIEGIKPNIEQMQKNKVTATNNLKLGLDNFLLKPRKIARYEGKAEFIDAHTVKIVKENGEEELLTAENFVISVGSEPAMIPAFNIDKETIITSDEALELKEIPESMIVIGAGAIGLEFSYVFSSLGCNVTIVEMMPNVVPALNEKDITSLVENNLKKAGITIKTGVGISKVEKTDAGAVCTLANGEAISAQKVLVAIGRKLNTNDMGLEKLGIEVNKKGQIIIDEVMRTSVKNIYAVGDITQGPQLSHKAQKQALVAAEHIAGMTSSIRYDVIPWAIFMNPEIAAVGITQADAEKQGIETICGKMKFSSNEKALCMQHTEGLIKIVAEKESHKIIGAQIFGHDASVLISELSVAMEAGLKLENIALSIHAHPTLPEIVMETAKNALGFAFHK